MRDLDGTSFSFSTFSGEIFNIYTNFTQVASITETDDVTYYAMHRIFNTN